MNNPYCEKHVQEMTYREGVSKAGKPYKLYKCESEGCDHVQWINEGKKNYKKPQPLMTDEQYQNIMNALRKLYALIESKK